MFATFKGRHTFPTSELILLANRLQSRVNLSEEGSRDVSDTALHQLPQDIFHLRVLYVILSYDLQQFSLMLNLLDSAGQMCHFGWSIHVVLHTTVM